MQEKNQRSIESKSNSNFINIDESGKIKVQDEEVTKLSEELELSELENVSGAYGVNFVCPSVFKRR